MNQKSKVYKLVPLESLKCWLVNVWKLDVQNLDLSEIQISGFWDLRQFFSPYHFYIKWSRLVSEIQFFCLYFRYLSENPNPKILGCPKSRQVHFSDTYCTIIGSINFVGKCNWCVSEHSPSNFPALAIYVYMEELTFFVSGQFIFGRRKLEIVLSGSW